MDDTTKLREQSLGKQIGAQLAPITSAAELRGDWEMRFGGSTGSDRVQWRYGFRSDGSVVVGDEQWSWRLNDDGSLSLLVPTPADPTVPGLDNGLVSEELMFPFKAEDGRVILANEDTSLIEVLTRVAS